MDVKQVKQIMNVDLSKHFEKLGDFMDGLFDDLNNISTFGGNPEYAGIRVTKSKGDGVPVVTVEVEVPGCGTDDVHVEVISGQLSVEWTPKMTGKKQSRVFSLSKSADVAAVEACVRNGYLTVTVPGVAGKTESRRVSVCEG